MPTRRKPLPKSFHLARICIPVYLRIFSYFVLAGFSSAVFLHFGVGMQSRAKKSSLVRRTQDGHRVSREGGERSHIRADKRQCIVGGSRQICGRHLYAGSAYLPQRSLDSGPMHKLLWVPVPFRILGWEEDTEDSEDDGEDEDTDDSDSGGHDDDEDDEYEDGDDETRR